MMRFHKIVYLHTEIKERHHNPTSIQPPALCGRFFIPHMPPKPMIRVFCLTDEYRPPTANRMRVMAIATKNNVRRVAADSKFSDTAKIVYIPTPKRTRSGRTMAVTFTDPEIDALIHERKIIPCGRLTPIRFNPNHCHSGKRLRLTGQKGNEFLLILRQNQENRLDFSVILAVRVPKSGKIFRLLRYNGKSHSHTNRIEGKVFDEVFHIHIATERYQKSGAREDSYAESTDRYDDLYSALNCLIHDANLVTQSEA